jgi:hypothetical protein
MRKLVYSVAGVVAVLALTASLATGATAHPVAHSGAVRCGGLYQPPCVAPTVIVHSAVACKATGATLHFPIRLHSIAGLSSATVKLGNRTIKVVKFHGSPTTRTITVSINTRGDKPGLRTITVRVVDTRGKSGTGRAHFTICRPAPVFTG